VAIPDSRTASVEPAIRVSTLELFFDLVFVFTLTQLTDSLVHGLDAVHVLRVVLMLGVIWWMYSGYAWLTNAVAPSSTTRRTLLLTGMAGFLVIALAIPHAFDDTGWAFGIAYFVVNLVHTGLFIRAGGQSVTAAMRSLAPFNLVSASLVLVGGFLPAPWRYGCWAAALALQSVTPYLRPLGGFHINATHFVERHGLVIIVAIGESVVAVGLGIAAVDLDHGTILVAILGLCIAYYLYWAYFSGDDERAEHVLAGIADPLRRARTALRGWGYAHYFMILGIVLLATGVKTAVGHAFGPLAWWPAAVLSGGAALFLLAHAWFVRILGIRGAGYRLAAAAGVLLVIPLGHLKAVAQLAAVPLIMAAALIAEDLPRVIRARSTGLHTFGRTAGEPQHPEP
jgi:low temperature requirement protein LtrA